MTGRVRQRDGAKTPRRGTRTKKDAKTARATPPASSAQRRAEAAAPEPRAPARPTIVALGASAGGLAVFERFLRLMRPGGNLAFLLVSHLDPSQESFLPELLAPHTKLTVTKAANGARIEADHVYVIPPNAYMTLKGGTIRLGRIQEPRGARFPIDVLLRSLAEDQQENAVAVIFTGTGADGTDGLRSIKDNGGVVIVQDPQTVEYPGMPESAIATGIVDFVLPVEQMPDVLLGYARHSYSMNAHQEGSRLEATGSIRQVLALLRARGDTLDYSAYKTGTLTRRIHRRMGLAQVDRITDYLAKLRRDPAEVESLKKDLLISVTHFFRDPDAWKVLERDVIPRLFKGRSDRAPIRVWVPGCSTGEEAYSMAMALLDHRRSIRSNVPIQIFATDVNPTLLDLARTATYDKSSVAHIPPDKLGRYFVEEAPNSFRATKELRESVAFAVHDLIADPPFSRIDLVSCRNVLIYLQPETQRRIIGLFAFGLNQNGFLFLGSSEGVVSQDAQFEPTSKKWRIYRHTAGRAATGDAPPLPAFPPPTARVPARDATPPARGAPARQNDLASVVQKWLLQHYAPATVVVDQHYDILQTHGSTNPYLELPSGAPVLNLLTMAPADHRGRLRIELHKARTKDEPRELTIRYPNADKTHRTVHVRIRPLNDPKTRERMLIVTFEPAPDARRGRKQTAASPAEATLIRELEAELSATKSDLQGTIESLETANEEMRASSEEIMSMNEEFRSTNEELETSKEELQSLNEELNTVNSQLREKIQALELATNDLTNLLSSSDIPTLFLDGELHIRRFADANRAIFNLIPSDIGRPLADIALKVNDDTLAADARESLRTLAPAEKQLVTPSGKRYLRRIRPYRTRENRIEGVVVTFVDIEALKTAEDHARTAGRYAEEIVATLREPLLGLDARYDVISANRAFYEKFETTPGKTIGRSFFSLLGGIWGGPEVRATLSKAFQEKRDVRDLEVKTDAGTGTGVRTFLLNSTQFPLKEDEERILLAITDVTDAKRDRERAAAHASELEVTNQQLKHINEALDSFSHVVGHDLKEPARAVGTLLTLLEEDHAKELSPPARKLVADARAATDRLGRLLTGLLALSRASRLDAKNRERVGIGETLASEACRARYETLLAERKATLEAPRPDVFVHATHEHLCQVLGNLVLNAIRHNPKPHPHVRVRAAPANEKGLVEVVVEDNGPGFAPELIMGFENMTSTTRGFGLIIARRAVENLGGRMWLGSTPDGGAAVHFTLHAPAHAPASK